RLGNRALVLEKTSAPVEPVPARERVERVEELLVGDEPRSACPAVARVVEAIEETHSHGVQQPFGRVARHGVRARHPGRPFAGLCARGVTPAHENAPPEGATPRETVDPADRVRPLARAPEPLEHRLEPAHALGLEDDPWTLHATKPDRGLDDQPG